ncbi:sugar phosphate isomerase/epimerase [Candidatus Sumerlaeota bacterium]|nr:sugar phosphate isomerase/epimerase [Candidatus Sumerlaeota bacterium]
MYFTGFADEASPVVEKQIQATLDLGWSNIEARVTGSGNLHDIPDDEFEQIVSQLEAANVNINCFGSAIFNWAKQVTDPLEPHMAEVERAIPRMKRLGTKLVRVMSYALLKDRGPEDQMEEERFARMRKITDLFLAEGLQPVHENCMNYGGMSSAHTLRLLENVPGLKLVFDTGNPVFNLDYSKSKPYPWQSAWEFYQDVKEHVVYIHIKDAIMRKEWDGSGQRPNPEYRWPGEGDGDVRRILTDLLQNGYDGGISIEPHLGTVFHDETGRSSSEEKRIEIYQEYGRRLMKMVRSIQQEIRLAE